MSSDRIEELATEIAEGGVVWREDRQKMFQIVAILAQPFSDILNDMPADHPMRESVVRMAQDAVWPKLILLHQQYVWDFQFLRLEQELDFLMNYGEAMVWYLLTKKGA